LAGTTGAGKTTLLRHAIGSSHEREAAAAPTLPIEAAPIYELGGLELALRDAVDSFLL
jgi:hypothetical protein